MVTLFRLNFYFWVHFLTLLEKRKQTISTVGNPSNLVQIVITLLGSELVIITNYWWVIIPLYSSIESPRSIATRFLFNLPPFLGKYNFEYILNTFLHKNFQILCKTPQILENNLNYCISHVTPTNILGNTLPWLVCTSAPKTIEGVPKWEFQYEQDWFENC